MDTRLDIAADLWDRAISIAESLDPDDWRRPTPCTAWDVHGLLAHLGAIQTMMDSGKNPPPPDGWAPPEDAKPMDAWTAVGVAARRDWPSEAIIDELREAKEGHLERLRTRDPAAMTAGPTGETSEQGLFATRCFDLWVHIQDLHDALCNDLDLHDPSPAVETVAQFTLERVPWMFGKRVGAPEGAALRLRLSSPADLDDVLVIREGRARWDANADPGEDSVVATPAALVLLAAGRGDAERWREAGVLSWTGSLGGQFVQHARLF